MWKNMKETDRPQMKIWSRPIACWITKATDKLRHPTATMVAPQYYVICTFSIFFFLFHFLIL